MKTNIVGKERSRSFGYGEEVFVFSIGTTTPYYTNHEKPIALGGFVSSNSSSFLYQSPVFITLISSD